MKQLYTFKWDNGKVEEPLQAASTKQALWVLIYRYQQKDPSFDKFIVLNAFRDGRLDYTLDEPYQHIRNPNPKPSKPKKKEPAQLSFKGFTGKNPWPDL